MTGESTGPMAEITDHDCAEACPLADAGRRAFLRDAALAAAGIAASLGIAGEAGASTLRFIEALERRQDERSYPIPAADGVQIDKQESIIVARLGNKAWAFSLACPHQNTALRWQPTESRFVCPKHKSRYAADGKYISGRATRSMDRFAVRRVANTLVVNLDKLYQQTEDPTGWALAVVIL
jgi:Rieske Fe-S protein